MIRTCSRSRCGFTLFEVLVALALATALLGSVFSFYFNLLNTRQRLLEKADQFRAATTLINRLEAELLVCVASSSTTKPGVRGDNQSLTIASRGVAASLAERGVLDSAVFADLQITEYTFQPRAGSIQLSRWSAADESSSTSETLTTNIARVRFRYYNGSQWRDSFDSHEADALPRAVEIAIWFDTFSDETSSNERDNERASTEGVERETFDSAGGFDEFEFARRDDRSFEDEPLPDRLRIIRIPDAAEEDVLDDGEPTAEADS